MEIIFCFRLRYQGIYSFTRNINRRILFVFIYFKNLATDLYMYTYIDFLTNKHKIYLFKQLFWHISPNQPSVQRWLLVVLSLIEQWSCSPDQPSRHVHLNIIDKISIHSKSSIFYGNEIWKGISHMECLLSTSCVAHITNAARNTTTAIAFFGWGECPSFTTDTGY